MARAGLWTSGGHTQECPGGWDQEELWSCELHSAPFCSLTHRVLLSSGPVRRLPFPVYFSLSPRIHGVMCGWRICLIEHGDLILTLWQVAQIITLIAMTLG